MFDITSDDISQLNHTDLRELVGLLCEAELSRRELSSAYVTWGGNQTAADGGLDVRVALPLSEPIDGFVPRRSTGFQVKASDMPRSDILAEMRPSGAIRPVIQDLADEAGAYVIVSSKGSVADRALRNRREALREALEGVANADQLQTDFYDRTRLATWVRCHPGLVTWVKERVGRALGWRPYGPWSGEAEGVDAEYLLDDKLSLHLGKSKDAPAQSVAEAIDELRDGLAQPGKIVRLVGLSGVGKTRLVQALFDSRIGSRPLPLSLAVYTNLSDEPDPQPTGLASDLIAKRARAVLVVDNCPPDLHRRLSDLCRGQNSTVSVLTVEYDVRDDQPEGTEVVILDTSSPELIEKLVRRRYPHVSQVDVRTIAEVSGGNARIAIALADTVGRSETIAGLSDDELFQRLFRQRHDPDNALLLTAKACSLVYSFQGEALDGEEAELPRLAALAGQDPADTYRHVAEMLRRDLAQKRGVWRAVLPHAIASHLAARTLEDTLYRLIDQQLISGGTDRLARSFSRRLSFLHDHPRAVAIAQGWLASDGLLGDVTALDELRHAMFENVAPVLPEAALAALERVGTYPHDVAPMVWRRHLSLLHSLAYDPPLFERSVQLLVRVATENMDERDAKEASETFASLFTIYLSGTHATIEQRLGVIERLLRSGEAKAQALGLAALDRALEATHFSSGHRFEFGARSRDYGYQPQSGVDVAQWYGAALTLIERMALNEGVFKPELCDLLARNFRGLWTSMQMHDELETLFRRFRADGFWREGWVACRETLHYDRSRMTPGAASRLSALEADLRPPSLLERARAAVLGNRFAVLDPVGADVEEGAGSAYESAGATVRELGAEVGTNDEVFTELLPDLFGGGIWLWPFGRGLAAAAPDRPATWASLVEGLEQIAPEHRDVTVLRVLQGFLAELWEQDRDLAQTLLDSALDQPALVEFLPALHSAGELDERGVKRLERVLRAGQVPVRMFRNLAGGRTTDHLGGGALRDLLLLIATQSGGFDVALEILFMRLYSDRLAQREYEPELIETGRELLRRIMFRTDNQSRDYELGEVVRACLAGTDAGPIAGEVAARFGQAVAAHETHSFDNVDLLKALLEVQPAAVLDALFAGKEKDQLMDVDVFEPLGDHGRNPADAISCEALTAWCDGDRENRYPLAASIITFARRPEETGPLVWSEQAKAILAAAPGPSGVLAVFIGRFQPMSWSGSRATLMEANAGLLDSLEPHVPSGLIPFVTEAKAQLAQEVARERQRETQEDRAQDEQFE